MSIPSTNVLDHIVHLIPPDKIEEASQQFRELGFNVIDGGIHAEGHSTNALMILGDGVYLELISFIRHFSNWPDRQRRASFPWSNKVPGWIACAFVGSPDISIASVINARAEQDNSGISYTPEVPGGRTRPDGEFLEWVVTAPEDNRLLGTVPFFCGDITPRELRVPVNPPSIVDHPSGAKGVVHLRVLVEPGSFASVSAQLTSVIGEPPQSNSMRLEHTWTLEPPLSMLNTQKPRLILGIPENDEEKTHLDRNGPGIYEVAVSVGPGGVEKEAMTPYSRIVWLRSSKS